MVTQKHSRSLQGVSVQNPKQAWRPGSVASYSEEEACLHPPSTAIAAVVMLMKKHF